MWLRDQFADRLYAGLRVSVPADMQSARLAARAAEQAGVRTVAVHPIYYLKPEQASLQRSVTAIRLITNVGPFHPMQPPHRRRISWAKSEMRSRYGEFQGALERTLEIADRCLIDLPVGQALLPSHRSAGWDERGGLSPPGSGSGRAPVIWDGH